jgi:phosphoenolpyruvate carboxykinase (GTP)
MADYWTHWLEMGQKLRATSTVPRIFQVNWFRKDENGRFLWPGFGENSRVLEWILDRVDAQAPSVESPLGLVPTPGGLNVDGLDLSPEDFEKLFEVDPQSWLDEVDSTEEFFSTFGERLPEALSRQLTELRARLREAQSQKQGEPVAQ